MGQYDNLGDEELITRLREGERGISDYLMEKYKDLVRKKGACHVSDRRGD